jgi:competence protein ComEC
MLAHVTVAFLIGLLFGSFLPYLPCTIALLFVLGAAGITVLEHRRLLSPARGLVVYGSLLAGAAYWTFCAGTQAGLSAAHVGAPAPVKIIGTIVEPVRYAPGRMVMTLVAFEVRHVAQSEPEVARLKVTWRQPDRVFFQGDRVELVSKVRPPTGLRNPGGFDYGSYLIHRGMQGVASVTGPGRVTLVAAPKPWSWWAAWHVIDQWRNRIREAAIATLKDPALGIFLGMVIGEPGYLTPAVRDAFMATGTVHILSISGSHLGLIAFLSFFVVKGALRAIPERWLLALSRRMVPSRLAALITVVPVSFYTLLAGSEVATVRSLVMILIFLVAVWLGRRQLLLTALATAALLILIHDPQALFDISFQLSYSSVLAIALVMRWNALPPADEPLPDRRAWRRALGWLRQYGWVTAGVTLATLPLVAYHFNQIAWLGLIGNLLVVPLAGMVLVPLSLGSAVWMLVTGDTSLPGGSVLQALFTWMLTSMQWLALTPGAEWHVASPGILAMLAFYLLLYLAIKTGVGRLIRSGCAIGVLVLLAWWGWSPRESGDGETIRVTFLDVGQGDATVVELPDGQTMLIDAGAAYDTLDLGRAVVAPFLWDRGIRQLDHVIATHPQLDHVGGLPWILRSFRVGRYWGSRIPREEPFYQRLQDVLAEKGLVEEKAEEGQVILSAGACRAQTMNPPPHPSERNLTREASGGKILNNLSVVVRLDCGPHSFLFTGDAEADALVRMVRSGHALPARVLKVPHHGARGSLDEEWIRHVRPEVAVISVGKQNSYGHPAPATVAAYAAESAQVFRTDRDGAVWVTGRLSEPSLTLETTKDILLSPLHLGPTLFLEEQRNLSRLWRQWTGWDT